MLKKVYIPILLLLCFALFWYFSRSDGKLEENHYWTGEYKELNISFDDISSISSNEKNMIFIGTKETDGMQGSALYEYDFETGESNKVSIELEGAMLLNCAINSEGQICVLTSKGFEQKEYCIYIIDEQKENIQRQIIATENVKDLDFVFMTNIECNDNYIGIEMDGYGVLVYDFSGDFLYSIEVPNLYDFTINKDSTVLAIVSKNDQYEVTSYSLNNSDYSKLNKVDTIEENIVFLNNSSELYLYDYKSLYVINNSGNLEEEVAWGQVGSTNGNILSATQTDNKSIYVYSYDTVANKYEVLIVSQTSQKPKEKEKITLVSLAFFEDVTNMIVRFNRSHSEVYIEQKIYGSSDIEEARKRINMDIMSGDIPDIIVFTDLNFDIMAKRGLLLDLYEYLEKDDEINLENYYMNILKSTEVKGLLLRIIPYFRMNAVLSNIDMEPNSLSFEKLKTIMENQPEGTNMLEYSAPFSILHFSLLNNGKSLVDWEKGELTTSKEQLEEYLIFANTYKTSANNDVSSDENLFQNMTIDVHKLSDLEQCKEDKFIVGIPTVTESTFTIESNFSLGISAKCKNKMEAWEFVREFLLPDYQTNYINSSEFPVLKAECLKRLLKKQQEDVSEATIKDIQVLIEKTSILNEMDNEINTIIYEEASSYFNGIKSAEAAADSILSRISIYMNENIR